MADDVTIDNGALTDFDVATDDVGSKHYQRVKVDLGADGASSPLVRGQQTKANSIPVTIASDEDALDVGLNAGTNYVGKVAITDGTDTADVFDLTNSNAVAVQIVDDNGDAITVFSGSGGTSALDDADFTQATTAGTPIQGVYESTATSVTDNDMGIVGIDQNRRMRVNIGAISATATGSSIFRSIDLDESEEEIKATAGVVYGMFISNLATTTRFVKFYNATAANVTVGSTTPVLTIPVPGNTSDDVAGVFNVGGPGIAFTTAITAAATTGVADADTGAPAANDVVINVFYE